MNHISRRGLVRIVSYTVALIITLTAACITFGARAKSAELKLETGYLRAVESLNDHMNSISSTLIKGKYANTAPMLESLANKLKLDTQGAKSSLSELPLHNLHLQNTYKFLSQLGEYALSLSKKIADGEQISDSDAKNMEQLSQYAEKLRSEIQLLEDAVQTGTTDFSTVTATLENSSIEKTDSPNFTDGFKEYEEGFSDFPSLIYDGPFSDHITQKTPLMTNKKPEITILQAKKVAASMTGLSENRLSKSGDENSKMPSYIFTADGITASVSKNGGYPVYYLNNRLVENSELSKKEAVKKARMYLETLSFGSMVESYYEVFGNIITINFAALQQDTVLYPDLIKVSVALDNGEILGLDARGYLTNHKERKFTLPKLNLEAAQKKVSPNLKVKKGKLTVIPSTSLKEKLCYEFLCTGSDHENILVYINANTGEEEEILILIIDENGTLTV